MSREQLGKLVGNRSRQAVARWEHPYNRDRNSVPDLETISEIAEALRLDFLWLLTGQNYSPDVEVGSGVLVPVYRLKDFHLKKNPEFYKKTPTAVPNGTDGLTLDDLSNSPEFMPLDICFMEPCSEPRPGLMMVGRLVNKRVNIFGECVISGIEAGGKQIFDIAPLNKKVFPRFSSGTEEIELLAVAIGHFKDLRNRNR
jgi:transcriptional regulator with XRE-family HTH domain